MINGNMVGASMLTPKSLILEDENGNSFVGVTVGEETIFDVQPSDVKINKTFAGENGVQVGENTVTYRTEVGHRLILPGKNFSVPLANYNQYDYTQFQAIIVLFSSDYSTNAEAMGVTINDSVFSVETSEKMSDITRNEETKSIELNITNNSESIYTIRYFTYRNDEEEEDYGS